jgi:hypothetical protein
MARPRDHRVRVRWSALPEKPFCSRDTLLIVDGREMIVDRRSLDGELTQPCAAGTSSRPNHAQPNRRSKREELYQFGSRQLPEIWPGSDHQPSAINHHLFSLAKEDQSTTSASQG